MPTRSAETPETSVGQSAAMNSARLTPFLIALAGAAALGLAIAANAAESAGPPRSGASAPGGAPPGPPPEAVAACKGKTEGTTVSFTGRAGETFSGTCQNVGGVLAARPAGGGSGGQRR
jgi:hypothetical protein